MLRIVATVGVIFFSMFASGTPDVCGPELGDMISELPNISSMQTEQIISLILKGEDRNIRLLALGAGIGFQDLLDLRLKLIKMVLSGVEIELKSTDEASVKKVKASVLAVRNGIELFLEAHPRINIERQRRLISAAILTDEPVSSQQLALSEGVHRSNVQSNLGRLERGLESNSRKALLRLRLAHSR